MRSDEAVDTLTRNERRKGDLIMRFMIVVKATKDSEAGVMPSQLLLSEMGNEAPPARCGVSQN
jgi:hypothetical protein